MLIMKILIIFLTICKLHTYLKNIHQTNLRQLYYKNVCPLVLPSFRPSVRPAIRSSVWLYAVCLFECMSVYLFARLPVSLFVLPLFHYTSLLVYQSRMSVYVFKYVVICTCLAMFNIFIYIYILVFNCVLSTAIAFGLILDANQLLALSVKRIT